MSTNSEQIKAVKRMQGFMESHLTEPITLAALARAAHYSPWHAARVFKEHTGRAPFEYLRQLRLSAAAGKLVAAPNKVIDVAFDFVFDSHEGFTRAFTRQFGLSPRQFRKARPPVVFFMPDRMRSYYPPKSQTENTMNDKPDTQIVFVQIVDRPARKLVLRRAKRAAHYFEYCSEVGCDVWEQLGAIPDALHEPMGLWLPKPFRPPRTSLYAQGVEVPADFNAPLPPGFDVIDLPPCQMMIFQGPPFEDRNFEQAIAALWNVMDSYRPENYGYQWADNDAPRFQLEPFGYRGYMEGRPVRPLAAQPSSTAPRPRAKSIPSPSHPARSGRTKPLPSA